MKRIVFSLMLMVAIASAWAQTPINQTHVEGARYEVVALQTPYVALLRIDNYTGEAWTCSNPGEGWNTVPKLPDCQLPAYDKPTYQVMIHNTNTYLIDTASGRTWRLKWDLNRPQYSKTLPLGWQEIRTNEEK